jgi:hypothetical protein
MLLISLNSRSIFSRVQALRVLGSVCLEAELEVESEVGCSIGRRVCVWVCGEYSNAFTNKLLYKDV